MYDIASLNRRTNLVSQIGRHDVMEGQRLAAEAVTEALASAGFVVTAGEYGGFASVEVVGRDGTRVMACPLFEWDPERMDVHDERWEYAVRGTDGVLAPNPHGADLYGCPDIWGIGYAGLRLDQGIAELSEVMAEVQKALGWAPAAIIMTNVAGVQPGQPASDFDMDPYPGDRPEGSWVLDRDGRCWPVAPEETMPSGWAVLADGRARCLDEWLAEQDAPPLAERVPLLSYGSNACPAKVVANHTPLPAVNLACDIRDLASVWCAGTTRAGRTPVTLDAAPGHHETAVVTMATATQLRALDRVEGRSSGWYTLQMLHSGTVTLENGAKVLRPAAYVGARPERYPLVAAGAHVRRVDVGKGQANLGAAPHANTADRPEPIGDEVPAGTYPSGVVGYADNADDDLANAVVRCVCVATPGSWPVDHSVQRRRGRVDGTHLLLRPRRHVAVAQVV